MNDATFQYDFRDLDVSVNQIESCLGYKEGESHEEVRELICKILEEAGNICDIRAEYRILPVMGFNDTDKSLKIGNELFQIGKMIFGQIRRSEMIAVFVCTAGNGPGERSRKAMKEGDLLKGYIYDVVGNETVESAACLMQDALEKSMAAENLHITNRFSPGYCGWDVAEQHKLFRLLPDNYCNIRLTPSSLMEPVKSVSGFIGIGEKVKRLPYTCNLCDMENCIYRRGRKK